MNNFRHSTWTCNLFITGVRGPGLAPDGIHTNPTLGHTSLRGRILPSPGQWMEIFVANMLLCQLSTKGCDYLINIRAITRAKGERGSWEGAAEVDFILEADSQCSYDVLLLLLSLKAIG